MLRVIFCCFLFLSLASAGRAENPNSILACENSLEKLDWDLEFFKKATQSIEVSACYTGGEILHKILNAFDERLQAVPELQIRLLLSPLTLEPSNEKHLSTLLERYPDRFHIVYSSNVVNIFPNLAGIDIHAKLVVVDEYYFSCGGTNLDDRLCSDGTFTPPRSQRSGLIGGNLPSGTRDADVVGIGSIAKDLRKIFYKFFALWKYLGETGHFINDPEFFQNNNEYWTLDPDKLPRVEKFETSDRLVKVNNVKALYSGTMHRPNHITKEYERLIRSAQNEIIIGNLYFCPADIILDSLMDAVNRNLPVTLITNGISEIAPQYTDLFCWANRINYVPLFYGRQYHFWEASLASKQNVSLAKIYEYNVKDILYHKKVMVVDRRYTIIGSYNLGLRSDLGDYEVVLVIDSPEIAEAEVKIMEKDKTFSVEVGANLARKWYFDPITAYLGGTQRQFHGFL